MNLRGLELCLRVRKRKKLLMWGCGQILSSKVFFTLRPKGTERNQPHLGMRAEAELESRGDSQLSSLKTREVGSPLQKQGIWKEAQDTGLSWFELQVNKEILVEGERKQI